MIKTSQNKSEAAQAVLDLISPMEPQSGYRAKILQIDNGREYRSNEFIWDLNKHRIALKEIVPYYTETNPVAERANRTIMTIV
jgi:transposase InsO family protein